MIIRNKYIAVLYSIMLVIAGLLCLNLHSLTHINHQQSDSHQTSPDSVPANKISDDCVLCLVSASGSADLVVKSPDVVKTETEQILFSNLVFLTHQTASVTVPRAPPAS